MSAVAQEKGHFKGRFRTRSGPKVSASFHRTPNGEWKIFSIGGVDMPTSFLTFELSFLPGQSFETLEEAKAAVKSA